ncbi:MAG: bifunctional diaminohydroxyphosphoribosylaminopyrimidine deaminase/5-amino-6-(5-phosphoribosylamino)uracil reductase RibD [bacterium]|nr:bifunctional diaminohydroxyphosphoribosylaminopyrimidine deaminase/5-amino-6-(5-phosphoribosylamino)uracil reductase RibD [bacterium]
MQQQQDAKFIIKTIQLAKRGLGRVNPNPMVGSIIVKDSRIIGTGFHKCFGQEHAEIAAIRDAGDDASGATLYVNLEPCCHHGKTPPCTEAIIQAGIKRVVIGMVDPNPLVNQQGIQILQQNGIEVTTGVEQQACQDLNRAFIKYITQKLPYVTIKIAQSLDGRIATESGHSQWITCEAARRESHRIRAANDAVIVGLGTVLADNPSLTVRLTRGKNPVRIVLDSHLRIPLNCNLLTDPHINQTIIATTVGNSAKIDRIRERGAHVWQLEKDAYGKTSISALMRKMAQARMSAVMVEGGAEVITSFLREKMADRIVFAIAPIIIGAGVESIGPLNIATVDDSIHLTKINFKQLGTDIIVSGDIVYRENVKQKVILKKAN